MPKFKPLSVGTLPRVFVNLLAQDDEEIIIFFDSLTECEEMRTWFVTTRIAMKYDDSADHFPNRTRLMLAEFFLAVLNLSKVSRTFFVKDFSRLLNELGNDDFWGTEGQCDPRGDRRDSDPYR